jgi:hypothetical protein
MVLVKRMLRLACFLGLALLLGGRAEAVEWVVLRVPGVVDEHAFDLSSVYLFADEVTFWHRVRPISPDAGYRLLRQRIQCTEQTLTTLTELEYQQDGRLLKVNTPYARDAQPINQPDERELAASICRLIGRKGSLGVAPAEKQSGETP